MIKPRSVMMYGVSGSTKTSQCYLLVKWILANNPGKKVRMIHSDGGGYAPFQDSGMVDRGDVDIYDLSTSLKPLNDYRLLSDGYWPRKTKEGGLFLGKVDACKTTPEEFNNIAGYVIEGMSSTGEAIKSYCSRQKEGVGFKESWSITTEDGDTILGLQQGHYGIVQREIYERHSLGFNCLPVPWLIYTSLLGKGDDKNSKETVYGPQVVGNASTPSVPQWFMDCLHLSEETYIKKEKDGTEQQVTGVVAWFIKHPHSLTENICLCKARVMPELFPMLKRYFPYGFVPLDFTSGIVLYFRVLEKLKESLQTVTS